MLPKRITSYQHYFSQVYRKRIRYVNRVALLAALVLSVLLQLPYGNFWWTLAAGAYRVPVLFVALWAVKLARQHNSVVEYSTAKTLAAQVVASVCSRTFVSTHAFFTASSYLLCGVFLAQLPLVLQYYVLAKEYRLQPAINDAWVYFWFHAYFASLLYSVQHVVFQRNRLLFRYGVYAVRPGSVLFAGAGLLLGNALGFTLVSSVVAPVLYFVARSAIYRLNWLVWTVLLLDAATPPFHIGFGTWLNVAYVLFFLFLAWEAINHTFNIYATIGCLDGKEPICSASEDPVATLLSGLRDVDPANQISRLSSFQELAYLATATGPDADKRRNAIYNTQAKSSFVWPAILDECALVIKDTSSRVNYRSKSDLAALEAVALRDDSKALFANDSKDKIFGNSDTFANDTTNIAVSAASSPIKKYDAQPKLVQLLSKLPLAKAAYDVVWLPLSAWLAAYLTPQVHKPTSFVQKMSAVRASIAAYHKQFLASNVGALFRITPKRDAESRVVNPANFGNAVIALSGLLMHAVEEDRNLTITNSHISEVLNLLERPIRACANYTDMLPASVYLAPGESEDGNEPRHHLVALLHDLTMNEFFCLCVKYNYKLNDLLLSLRAFKLAKWVIDASIAQQQKMTKTNMAKLY